MVLPIFQHSNINSQIKALKIFKHNHYINLVCLSPSIFISQNLVLVTTSLLVINGSLSQEDPLHSFADSVPHPSHFCCFSRIWSSLQAIILTLPMVLGIWPSFAVPSKRSSTTIWWRSHTSLTPSRSLYRLVLWGQNKNLRTLSTLIVLRDTWLQQLQSRCASFTWL